MHLVDANDRYAVAMGKRPKRLCTASEPRPGAARLFSGDQGRKAADVAQPFRDATAHGYSIQRRPPQQASRNSQLGPQLVTLQDGRQRPPRVGLDRKSVV